MDASTEILSWYDRNKYNSLFTSIVLLILAPPFLYKVDFLSFLIYILLTFVMVNCLYILFGKPKKRLKGLIIGLFSLGFVWLSIIIRHNYIILELIANALLVLMFGFTFAKLVREIFGFKKVSGKVVIGAIGAYLLLGLMGAFLFDVIEILYPESFDQGTIYSGFYGEIYLSFVTISTLGYGDITPLTPQGQAAAIFVSISGQLYLAILMAMLVGKFLKDSDW